MNYLLRTVFKGAGKDGVCLWGVCTSMGTKKVKEGGRTFKELVSTTFRMEIYHDLDG